MQYDHWKKDKHNKTKVDKYFPLGNPSREENPTNFFSIDSSVSKMSSSTVQELNALPHKDLENKISEKTTRMRCLHNCNYSSSSSELVLLLSLANMFECLMCPNERCFLSIYTCFPSDFSLRGRLEYNIIYMLFSGFFWADSTSRVYIYSFNAFT